MSPKFTGVPQEGAGAGMGIGMCWGGGIPFVENKNELLMLQVPLIENGKNLSITKYPLDVFWSEVGGCVQTGKSQWLLRA